jgi:hypothetical protein
MNGINIYYPYISDKLNKKYYIITNEGKRVYFGAAGYEHYTEGHFDIKRRDAYIRRHQKKENWNNPNSAGFWSFKLLWSYPTFKEAIENIRKELIKKKYL